MRRFLLLPIVAFVLAGCGGRPAAAVPTPTDTLVVQSAGNALAFVPVVLAAPAGRELKVQFTSAAAVPHNWVLVRQGEEQRVNDAAAAAGGDARTVSGVLAATALIQGGAAQLTVPPLQPGRYTYICTVPAHLTSGMRGTLVVQ